MEQMLKLKKELSEGKKEVEVMRTDIKDMENNLQQQEIIMKSLPHDKKVVSWSDLQGGTIQVAKMYRTLFSRHVTAYVTAGTFLKLWTLNVVIEK